MEKQERKLAEKKVFFAALDALEKEDEDLDEGIKASMQAMVPPFAVQATAAIEQGLTTPTSGNAHYIPKQEHLSARHLSSDLKVVFAAKLKRGHTLPEHLTGKIDGNEEVVVVKDTPTRPHVHQFIPPTLRHTLSVPSTISSSVAVMSSTSKTGAKRKRGEALPMVSETQRIFAGLKLYFVPNNDIAKARKMKIEKAVQYGASWEREWSEHVTHVVVDKEVTYIDVMKAVGVSELPSNVILVNDEYPADCISWRMLVDPTLYRFAVKGRPLAAVKPPSPSPSAPSQTSLQIKPVKRKDDVVVYDVRTPSRTDEDSAELLRRQFELEQEDAQVGQAEDQSIRSRHSTEHGHPQEAQTEPNKPFMVPQDHHPAHLKLANSNFVDPLQEAIAKTKAVEHLPMNSDDEETPPSTSADDSDSQTDSPKPSKPPRKKKPDPLTNFSCMRDNPSISDTTNPNAKTIEILQEMASYYDSTQDRWRTVAYRKAIAQLRKQTIRITTKEEAEAIPFVGSRLAAKIEEIVITNRLRRLDNTKLDPSDQSLSLFAKIYGVGPTQASKWVRQGYKTLEDLLAHAKLTENQRLGIAHFDDFLARIPRAEVEQHGGIVRRELQRIDEGFEVTIGGSYRRGAKDSGDVDIVITKVGASAAYLRTIVLDTLVPRLFKQNFLTAALAVTSKDDGSKWHGACHHPSSNPSAPNLWRRIDLLLVPYDELGAAMIYFTGNDIFNRSMRLLAKTKGMRLNQRGLYKDVSRGTGGEKLTEGTRVAGADEREIFEVLGVPWREKEERNC